MALMQKISSISLHNLSYWWFKRKRSLCSKLTYIYRFRKVCLGLLGPRLECVDWSTVKRNIEVPIGTSESTFTQSVIIRSKLKATEQLALITNTTKQYYILFNCLQTVDGTGSPLENQNSSYEHGFISHHLCSVNPPCWNKIKLTTTLSKIKVVLLLLKDRWTYSRMTSRKSAKTYI